MNPAIFALLTTSRVQAVAGGGGPLTPDLLWWKMNDSAGAVIAADVGPAGTTDGTLNNDYLALNGTSQEVQSNSAIVYSTPVITLSYWVYVSSWAAAGENVHFESGANYGSGPIRFNIGHQNNALTLNLYASGGGLVEDINTASISLADTTWYHFAVVFDNDAGGGTGDFKLYINGTLRTLVSILSTKATTGNLATETLNLGSRNAAGSWLDGRIDDVRIYSSELDATAIDAIHTAGRQ
jgi:hypothetical protein